MTAKTCWQRDDALEIMRVDAGEPDDTSNRRFLATHVAQQARYWTGQQWDHRPRPDGVPETLDGLADLVETAPMDASMCWIAGDPGTGKSHMVRWLWLRKMQVADDSHRVVFIPRSDTTSLRKVVDRIIGKETGPGIETVREALDHAADSYPTDMDARRALLLRLGDIAEADVQQVIREGFAAFEQRRWVLDDRRLAENILSWIADRQFLDQLLADEGLAARIVATRLGNRKAEDREEEDLQFLLDDLPLSPVDEGRASEPALELHRMIEGNPANQRRLLDLLNTYLDRAVQAVFGVKQGLVTDAALELRRLIKAQGQSLWLYFEDFAVLQGVQRELLDVFVDNGSDYCDLRVVAAITPGPLEQLPNMVWGRTTIVADLNMANVDAAGFRDELTGRYLNALRLGLDTLRRLPLNQPAPNRCSDCPLNMKEKCFKAFGTLEVEGLGEVGLYPLNRKALERASASKIGPNGEATFVPRFLVTNVLQRLTHGFHDAIESGRFPTRSVALEMTTHDDRLDDGLEDVLARSCESVNIDRATIDRLLSYQNGWGTSRDGFDPIPEGVQTLFSLPEPPADQVVDPPPNGDGGEGSSGGGPPPPPPPPRVPDDVREIRRWSADEDRQLPEQLRRDLQGRLHGRALGLLRLEEGRYGPSRWSTPETFKPDAIAIDGRAPKGRPLVVHLNKERGVSNALAALAWEASADSLGDTPAVLSRARDTVVDRIADDIRSSLLNDDDAKITAVCRLLLITGVILGLDVDTSTPEETVRSVLLPTPDRVPTSADPAWGRLRLAAIGMSGGTRRRDSLRDHLLSYVAYTQGEGKVHAIDYDRLVGPAVAATSHWDNHDVGLPKELSDYAKELRAAIDREMSTATSVVADWVDIVKDQVPDDVTTVAVMVAEAVGRARNQGLFPGVDEQRTVHELERVLNEILHRDLPIDVDSLRSRLEDVEALKRDTPAQMWAVAEFEKVRGDANLLRTLLTKGRTVLERALAAGAERAKGHGDPQALPDPTQTLKSLQDTTATLRRDYT